LGDGGTLVLGQDQDIIGGGFDAAEAFLGEMDEVRVWSAVRTSQQIVQNRFSPLAGNESGLVAYYRFNEGVGTTANDATGLRHHGTLRSGVNWLPHTPYNPGNALDVANGSVRIPSSPSFNTLPMTLMTWMRASGTTLKARWALTRGPRDAFDWVLMLEPNGTLSASYLATLSTGVAIYEINGGNGGPVNDERWHHVAFTIDNSGGRLYVDGILKATRGWSGQPAANNSANVVYLGSPDFPFNGQLDEVSLWNVALGAGAIQTNMNRRLTGAESGLLALYHFDESGGTLVADSAPGLRHGTILSNSTFTASQARIHGTAQVSGRVTSLGSGLPNIPVTATLPPLTVSGALVIPDGGVVTSLNPITSQRGTLGSVKVAVNINHPFVGDLELTLIHPDGTEVRLKNADSTDETDNLLTSYPDGSAPAQSLDALRGKSVAGIWRLRVRDTLAMDIGSLNNWSLQFGASTVTDATGRYAISNLLTLNSQFAEAYSVQPVREGLVFNPLNIVSPPDRTNIDFTLVSGSIGGHVRDNTIPFPGATISAGSGLSTTSGVDGSYQLSGLPPGVHTLTVSAPGYGFTPPQLSNLPLGVTAADFFVIGYPVSGRITDLQSNGVSGVRVTSGSGGQPGMSDGEGNYTIAAGVPGSSFISPSKTGVTFSPDFRRINIGPAVSNVDFSVIQSPPSLTTIPAQVIPKDSSTGPLRFDVNDRETRPAFLQVAGTSSNTNLVPTDHIVFDGVGSQRTVEVTPVEDQAGTTHITVVVTDESGLSTSKTFLLRVNQAPLPGVGRALTFNGLTNWVSTTNSGSVLADKGTFTVEAWASAPSNSGPRTLLAQGDLFRIRLDAAGQIQVGTNWSTGALFPFGDWHHLAVVRETADTRLYVDGVLRASRGSALPYPRQNIPFLVGSFSNAEYWLGGVDEVRVWNTARSAAEIASYANVRVMGNRENLGALWRLDEAASEWALDSSLQGQVMRVAGPVRAAAALRFESYVTVAGRNINDTLQAFDADGDPLTFAIVSQPTRGTVLLQSPNSGEFLYTVEGVGQDQFSFTVSDGYVTSEAHTINITTLPDTNAPTISFIADQVIAEDTVLGPLPFTVGDSERLPHLLTVVAGSSDQSLVPNANISITGTADDRFVTLRPATNAFGSVVISLTVSDGAQQTTSSFVLTVTPVHDAPTVTLTNMAVGNGQSFSQPIQVWAPDRASGLLTYSVSVFPVSGPSGQITAGVGQCSDNGTTVPCVMMTSSAEINYYGTNRVTVTVNDGLLSGQTSFIVVLRATPRISGIPDQHTLRDVPTVPFYLTGLIYDQDTGFTNLALNFSSSNPALVDASSFRVDPTYYSLTIVPRPGAFGQSMITLTASDGVSSASTTFKLVVENPANYQVVELPALPGAQSSDSAAALRLNDNGQVVGWSAVGGLPRAVVWDVNGSSPTVTALFNTRSMAFDINNRGQIVGHNNNTPFVYNNGVSTNLGGVTGSSYAMSINDSGEIVGAYDSDTSRFFYFNGSQQTVLNTVFYCGLFPGEQRGLAINSQGDVFGAGVDVSAGWPRQSSAQVWANRANRTLLSFNSLTADWLNRPIVGGINNSGWVCVSHWYLPQNAYFPILFNYRTSTTNSTFSAALAAGLPELRWSFARDLNDSSQVVGYGETFFGVVVPYLYTDGKAYRLAELMVGSGISPVDVRAINATGDIVGYGTKPGVTGYVPFLLRNRVFVGEPQIPPGQAINPVDHKAYAPPVVSALDSTSPADVATAYVWSEYEQKLFFVRPMLAAVTWSTSTNTVSTNATKMVTRFRVDWPPGPQIHIAGAPADAGPVSTAWPYRPLGLSYTTAAATLDPSTRTFNAANPGYSVIRYLLAPGTPLNVPPDSLSHSNYFEVVRTLAWNDPAVLRNNVSARVGVKVTDPRGPSVTTNSFKSGWAVFPLAPYDGVGPDRAYDRATQTGPIIPVNQDTASTNDDLVVAYYQRNPITGVLWPDLSVRYAIAWPTDVQSLVIANSAGSGPLPESQYPDKRVYVQPNPNLPGYNPNEEHAFLGATSSGQGVFAVRNDLNRGNTSSNYVLLKYRNPANGEWQFKLFQPVLTDATHGFTLSGDAGQEILPPRPIGFFTICPETTVISGNPNVFRDHRGKFYARTGPTPTQLNPQIVMRYSYPLQADFFYDLDGNGTNDVAVGDCVRWDGIAPGRRPRCPWMSPIGFAGPTIRRRCRLARRC
jgi:subtilisin-like proprotein convertase family protein